MKLLFLVGVCLPLLTSALPGGVHKYETNLENPNVAFAVNAINDYFKSNNDPEPRAAEEILSASYQVVAGILYTFKIELSGGETNDVCDVQVLFRAWLSSSENRKVTSINCNSEANVGKMLNGGEESASLDDPYVKSAYNYYVNTYNAMSNNVYRMVPDSVGPITKQIVNGVIYRFKEVSFVTSTCRNNADSAGKTTLEECPANPENSKTIICDANILWNPRSTPAYKLLESKC